MPKVVDEKIPYEILVRFGDDGLPIGAHVCYRRVITLDGEILKNEELPAEPIDTNGFPTNGVMSAAMVKALAQISNLQGLNDQAVATIGSLEDDKLALRDEIESLKAQLVDRDEIIQKLNSEVTSSKE